MIYEFAATQDLHGYGKPWAPGANVNKLPPSPVYKGPDYNPSIDATILEPSISAYEFSDDNGIFTAKESTATPGWIQLSFKMPITPDTDYYVQGKLSVNNGKFGWIVTDEDLKVLQKTAYYGAGTIYTKTFKADENAAWLWYQFIDTAPVNNSVIKLEYPLVCEGDSEVEFSPYANICMPEGFNIWDPDNAEYVQVYAGYVNANTRELYLRPVYEEYAGEELVGPWMSSLDPYEEDTTPTEGAFVIDFGGELTSYEITPFMLQTLLDSLGIRQHFTNGAGLLNSLMDQAQGRVRSEEELLHLSRPLNVIAIGDQLPAGLTFKPISKDVLPGLPGKFIR